MFKGFRDFLTQGNVMDLAVAVIIGAAFTQVVTTLTDSVLMPFISALVGSPNFDDFAKITLNGNELAFGVLLTAIVNFLLIAAAVYFAIVMPMNKLIEMRGKHAEEEPTEEVALLTEIRDALVPGTKH
ncbi:MAG: large conductance mechanosensitive channel protein MscL [Yaniella sp.]|uniref:large conductance mechanosensitive channel protein MscL n=1 Tax=Yaniella sp. TaxID=2773929 RepID=UPI002647E671|nr:large conductance mechanosensitive channel protein MscL [Yaniella sp.]MDN5705321.1 large conductance mechanosensitive channel protein MscL [Yaniella sp.]MDN5730460.1 large conductance mechanosensitive channel protein MscL [Yaniella sp.]MDN5815681.1 large conductance mechanosensitive channel protein MscL [Yaniella sp.]MDN5816906.1 large conductance mechanosensitive channel protein MscL [Yaniella sp.]MDN5837414.1 large conductance mechanosensitive channel protein MscL [Yaniella sp.]